MHQNNCERNGAEQSQKPYTQKGEPARRKRYTDCSTQIPDKLGGDPDGSNRSVNEEHAPVSVQKRVYIEGTVSASTVSILNAGVICLSCAGL